MCTDALRSTHSYHLIVILSLEICNERLVPFIGGGKRFWHSATPANFDTTKYGLSLHSCTGARALLLFVI